MAVVNVSQSNTFEEWRQKTNELGTNLGDMTSLDSSFSSTTIVDALNESVTSSAIYSPLNITNGGTITTDDTSFELQVSSTTQLTIDSNGDVTATRDLIATRNVEAVDVNASGSLTVDGNTTLGNDSADTITFTGSADSDLVPGTSDSYTLGATNNRWLNVHSYDMTASHNIDGVNIEASNTLTTQGTLHANGAATLDGGVTTTTLTASSNGVIQGTLNVQGAVDFDSTLNVDGNITHDGTIMPTVNNSQNIGGSTLKYANIYATTFQGRATTANYADLAENYLADREYEVGTVMAVGGMYEVTAAVDATAHSVIGVVSENPAYLMNSDLEGGTPIALKGRVQVKISENVQKGDRLSASAVPGTARPNNSIWCFAVSLQDGEAGSTVEAVIL